MSTGQALSLIDVGRHLNYLGHALDAADLAEMAAADRPDEGVTNPEMLRLLEEELSLQTTAMAVRPTSLAEASVQLGVLFDFVSRIAASDVNDQISKGTLEPDLKRIDRALAGLTDFVSQAAGVDLERDGPIDVVRLIRDRLPVAGATTSQRSAVCGRLVGLVWRQVT